MLFGHAAEGIKELAGKGRRAHVTEQTPPISATRIPKPDALVEQRKPLLKLGYLHGSRAHLLPSGFHGKKYKQGELKS